MYIPLYDLIYGAVAKEFSQKSPRVLRSYAVRLRAVEANRLSYRLKVAK